MYRRTRFLPYLIVVLALSQLVSAQTTIKVMTFNMWGGGDNWNKCVQAMQNSGADIIGLQEASNFVGIATQLGFYYDEGTSTLSRYPITAVQGSGYGQAVTITLPSGKVVYMFNCHLTAYPYGPYELWDVEAALNAELQTQWADLYPILLNISSYIATGRPCFLTGDFNVASHLDYAAVPWKCSRECARAGLADSYHYVHPDNNDLSIPNHFEFDDPGITWTPKPAEEPSNVFDRIDFVYGGGNNVVCTASTELDSRNSVSPWPSDHRAVVSTFGLAEPNATPKAANPAPPDGVGYMDPNVDLSWTAGVGAVSHNIYFGTDPTPDAGEFKINKTSPNFDPGALQYGTTYYWRIDEVNGGSTVTGDVWSFTTQCIAGAVTGDITDDCIVDNWDLDIMARDWLLTDSDFSGAPINNPPIGWWKLDEGTGTVTDDASVNNNNGSIVSYNSAMWVSGHSGQGSDHALHFNGTSQYVVCATRTGSGPGTYPAALMPSNFTIACWVNLDSFVYFSSFVGNGMDTGANECGFFLYNYGWEGANGQDFGLAIRTATGTEMSYVETPNIYNTGTWYHLAATYDGQYVKIYVDGSVAAGPTDVGGPIRWISASSGNYPERFTIGVWKDPGYTLYVDGIADEVRYYNYALSQPEILTLAEATYIPLNSPANLVKKVPPGGPYDPSNPDIVNFKDFSVMAEQWLYGAPALP